MSGNTLYLSLLVHLPLPEAPLRKDQVSSCPEPYSRGALRQVLMHHCVPQSLTLLTATDTSPPPQLCENWHQ